MSTKNKINIKFSKELKRLRGRLNRKQFAKKLGVKYPTYLRYESGEIEPKLPIIKLARVSADQSIQDLKYQQVSEPKEPYSGENPGIENLLDALKKVLINLDNRLRIIESRLDGLEGITGEKET